MRRVHLRDRLFHASKAVHAPEGTQAHRAVTRIVADLHDERLPLPGAEDVVHNLPPRMPCLARPIPGTALVLCYTLRDRVVYVLAVAAR